ncbi:hypothetical protein L5515_003017 [Caenorhabditis briggsae]|uniref:SKP1 component dimerisation domain-containing protein n=1 Tax=Caenorhabditis briggsae TaxID=6238 RepID=A0AAE9EH59_CAEBR|nr:hypothetical protein L5515_003017 [Caenorhabditis briggsae]
MSSGAVFYTLESSDGMKLKISMAAAQQSRLLCDITSFAHPDGVLPIGASGATLSKIVQWCEYHQADPITDVRLTGSEQLVTPDWDLEFLRMSNSELFDLIIASNYLDINLLMNYACKKVALMGKGKTPEEMREVYDIPTDAEDEAEERRIREGKPESRTATKSRSPADKAFQETRRLYEEATGAVKLALEAQRGSEHSTKALNEAIRLAGEIEKAADACIKAYRAEGAVIDVILESADEAVEALKIAAQAEKDSSEALINDRRVRRIVLELGKGAECTADEAKNAALKTKISIVAMAKVQAAVIKMKSEEKKAIDVDAYKYLTMYNQILALRRFR